MSNALFDRTEILADQPFLGSIVPEFGDESLRELFEHPYRIIYRVLPAQVDVLAVVHSARQLPRSLANRD
jgi:plasmid stabilization system protein ParE